MKLQHFKIKKCERVKGVEFLDWWLVTLKIDTAKFSFNYTLEDNETDMWECGLKPIECVLLGEKPNRRSHDKYLISKWGK